MIRRPPRSTLSSSSAASDVYKRQGSTRRCGPGDFTTAPATTWPDWRHASTQSCAVGCSITVRSTVRRSTRSCNASTPTWCGGSARSTSGCGRRRRPSGVGGGSSSEPRACSRTGNGFLPSRLSGDQDDKSPVTGDCYAGICGSPGLKCPGPPDHLQAGSGPMVNPFPLSRRGGGGRANAHRNPMEPYRNEGSGLYRPRLVGHTPRQIPDGRFDELFAQLGSHRDRALVAFLSLIHISEPTRLLSISYAVF